MTVQADGVRISMPAEYNRVFVMRIFSANNMISIESIFRSVLPGVLISTLLCSFHGSKFGNAMQVFWR